MNHLNEQAAAQCSQAILGGGKYDGMTAGCAVNQCSPERTVRVAIEVAANRDFSAALWEAKSGHRITRAGWNASGQYVTAQHPDKGSKMGLPYLYLKNAQNEFVPWVPSQGDLFANDWAILPIQPL